MNYKFFLALVCLITNIAYADNKLLLDPISVTNTSPMMTSLGLPASSHAAISPSGTLIPSVDVIAANFSSENQNANEAIVLDGELTRLVVGFSYGISEKLDLQFSTQVIHHGGGALDSLIEDWHNAFGLPNGNRQSVPNKRLLYQYQGSDGSFRFSDSGLYTGNSQLSLGWNFFERPQHQMTLRAGATLPTGDRKNFSGASEPGGYIGAYSSLRGTVYEKPWAWHNSIGVVYPTQQSAIPVRQNTILVYGNSTLAWQLFTRASVKAQLDVHSAPYESELSELGSDTVQLSLGTAIQLGQRWSLHFSFSEDVTVETSPDITFQVGLKSTPP